ncbi:MAG: hypothetical protein ILP19_10045, partial [Oscillospiraceae bacterium]|nr:hypothetical protein [Oscillospiraceae bacterium]
DSVTMRMALGFSDGYDFFDKEEQHIMPEGKHDGIIRTLAERYLLTSDDIESFIALRKHKTVTAVNTTLGGHMWYEDIYELDGVRIQWHCKVPAVGRLLERHYRILGRNNELRAYYFDPELFIEDLMIFGEQKKSGKIR